MQRRRDRAELPEVVHEGIGPPADGGAPARQGGDQVRPAVTGVRHEFVEDREARRLAFLAGKRKAEDPREKKGEEKAGKKKGKGKDKGKGKKKR